MFKSDIIKNRYSIHDKNDQVLITEAGMQFIECGKSVWKFDPLKPNGMLPVKSYDDDNDKKYIITVDAIWLTARETKQHNIDIIAGDEANIFARLGCILVPNDFKIPAIQATFENVDFYGCKLIKNGDNFSLNSDVYDMVLASYKYHDNYRQDFEVEDKGGGGYFVEKHNFPHIHAPMNKDCGGYIILGKQLSINVFAFSAFIIPFGYALYTPPNAIHGDGTLVGKYAIAVAKASADANTVLFYNKNTKKKQCGIVPPWPPRLL